MAGGMQKTVKNATLRPFALSSGNVWNKIEYRYDPAESWRNALEHSFVVLPNTLQDVRRDANHAINIAVDPSALRADKVNLADIDLVILVRDNFSKKVLILRRQTLSDGLDLILEVDRHALEATSLSRKVDFEVMLLARNQIRLNGRDVRSSARLAKHVITVSTESQGLSFNFRKTSPAEFAQRGLPGTTTFHVELRDAADLIASCDDVSSVLKVLVHEDAWLTLQEIRSGNQLGEALGTMMGAELVFSILVAVRANAELKPESIEESSIIFRILAWLAATGGTSVDALKDLLFDEDGLMQLQARVQDSLKLTRGIKRVRLEEGEIE